MSGRDYYFGVTLDDDWWEDRREAYIKEYLTKDPLVAYRVQLVKVTKDNPNLGQLCCAFRIVEVLHSGDCWFICSRANAVGDVVYVYGRCDLETQMLPYNPRCGIGNGGCLECNGCYRSLVVPWSDYIAGV